MKSILVKGKYKKTILVDNQDYPRVILHKWYVLKGKGDEIYFRIFTKINKKITYLHRFILNALPEQKVDHINNNPLDNRRENLRFCTIRQNGSNKKINKNNKYGYKGVFFDSHYKNRKKKWRARICPHGEYLTLGYYLSAIEAAKSYNKAAVKYYGEFAKLNEVQEPVEEVKEEEVV